MDDFLIMETNKDNWSLASEYAAKIDDIIANISNEVFFDKNKDRASKYVIEEFLPLSRLALFIQDFEEVDVEVIGCGNSGPIDGQIKILNKNKSPIINVEITTAGFDKYEHLRNVLMLQNGASPSFGPIEREGKKIKATMETRDVGEHTDRVKSNIVKAFKEKATKKYPSETTLLISFVEPHIKMKHEWVLLFSALRDELITEGTAFSEVYLFNSWYWEVQKFISPS